MECSTAGFPVLHYFPEFAQTHVHLASDAIQPSHSLSSLSSPAFNFSQLQGLFQWVCSSHQVAKVLELQPQSFQWISRVDFFPVPPAGALCPFLLESGPTFLTVVSKVCLLSHFRCVWLFVTPWTAALHIPLSMGFSRQEYWNGLPCPSPGILPTQESDLHLLNCRQILYHWATREAQAKLTDTQLSVIILASTAPWTKQRWLSLIR